MLFLVLFHQFFYLVSVISLPLVPFYVLRLRTHQVLVLADHTEHSWLFDARAVAGLALDPWILRGIQFLVAHI